MPRGTPKEYEEKYKEENQLQMEADKKEIKRFIAKKTLEPEWDSWENRELKKGAYRKACEAGDEEARKEASRYLNTAKIICAVIGGYTCQAKEAKEALKELLKIMEEENLPARWAIKRKANRQRREAGYKYNAKTKTWYKPKEEQQC